MIDNYTWVDIKNEFNKLSDGGTLRYDPWYSADRYRYLNVLLKLGYIKRAFVYKRSNISGSFERVKLIPKELRWVVAQREAKSLNVTLKNKVKKYTLWNHIVEKINNYNKDTFNASEMFPFDKYDTGPNLYICKICKLGYIERLDRHKNYKIAKKIPENLTYAFANKMLTDKIYIRQRKIELLKEKMVS